jgi:hypothetical protein
MLPPAQQNPVPAAAYIAIDVMPKVKIAVPLNHVCGEHIEDEQG